MKILVINGPNMQLLGRREPTIYGSDTLDTVYENMRRAAGCLEVDLEFFQSNHEGAIVDKIGDSCQKIDGIIINPAAYSHSSIAIHDALKAVAIPTVEVHISNINSRETFRHTSITSEACRGVIAGFGIQGYNLALTAIVDIVKQAK